VELKASLRLTFEEEACMFEKVLVSMDLSPATEALVFALPGMRELGTRELTLVHVAKPSRGATSESLDRVEGYRGRLQGLAGRLEEDGF
jgi:hypothetical protein